MEMRIVLGGGMRVDAHWMDHTIATDQQPEKGGNGSAPEPFALFLASLGTCAGVYVQAFCQARGISTEGISLTQRMISAPDGKGLGGIEIDLNLPPEFPEKYEKAVLRVAQQCAVKKVLQNPPDVSMRAVRTS